MPGGDVLIEVFGAENPSRSAILLPMNRTFLFTTIFLLLAWTLPAMADTVIIPHRVIDARTRTVIDFEGLLARCSDARVVTLGENHDDPATHRIELAMLEGLYRHHPDLVFSMEMFERDVQNVLDQYLSGDLMEHEFIAASRPWGNYETDYRPLVEFCRENGIPVVASNIPRPLAGQVAQAGYDFADFGEEDLPFVAETFEAPEDAYWEAFRDTMMMPGMEAMGVSEDTVKLYYQAQVIKDETMAESVSRAAEANPDALVYHIAGAFHLADYLGTYPRIRRDLPGADVVSILVIPVDDLLGALPEDISKADYWILVEAPVMPDMEEMEGMPVMPPMPPNGDDEEGEAEGE
jgi:uncharacterized iron-regulated protein